MVSYILFLFKSVPCKNWILLLILGFGGVVFSNLSQAESLFQEKLPLNVDVVGPLEYSENTKSIEFLFSIPVTNNNPDPIKINYYFKGTAHVSEDFIDEIGTTEILPGTTTRSLKLSIVDDNFLEDKETIELVVVESNQYIIQRQAPLISLIDNEFYFYKINLEKNTYNENDVIEAFVELTVLNDKQESATIASDKFIPFKIILLPDDKGANIQGQLLDINLVSEQDYFARHKPNRLPIPLEIIDDSILEGDESFFIQVISQTGSQFGFENKALNSFQIEQKKKITIIDNETEQLQLIDFVPGKELNQEQAEITLGFNAVNGYSDPIEITYEVSSGTAVGGDFKSPFVDFKKELKTVSILPGEQTIKIAVDIYDDNESEEVEFFDFKVSQVIASAINITQSNQLSDGVSIPIYDKEKPLIELIKLSDLEEGQERQLTLAVQLNNQVNGWDNAYDFELELEGTATEGVDFKIDKRITLPTNQTSLDIFISDILLDNKVEQEEEIKVTLKLPADLNINKGKLTQTIKIEDKTQWFLHTGISEDALEGTGSPAKFKVEMVGVNDMDIQNELKKPLSVSFISKTNQISFGRDIVMKSQTLEIPIGEQNAVYEFEVIDDKVHESLESMELTLLPAISYTVGTRVTTNLAILDNEPIPEISLSTSTEFLPEEGGRGTLSISLINNEALEASEYKFSITLNTGGQAINGLTLNSDYYLDLKTIVFDPYVQKVDIPFLAFTDFSNNENNEKFLVVASIENAMTAVFQNNESSQEITILEQEKAPYFFLEIDDTISESRECSDAGVKEANTLILNVSEKLQEAVSLDILFEGDAVLGEDFEIWYKDLEIKSIEGGNIISFTLPANSIKESLIYKAINDLDFEGDEESNITILQQNERKFKKTITMIDDDANPNLSTINISPREIEAGSSEKAKLIIQLFDKNGILYNCLNEDLKSELVIAAPGLEIPEIKIDDNQFFYVELGSEKVGEYEISGILNGKPLKNKTQLRVFRKAVLPNELITPNQDGVNDFWKIAGIEEFPDNEVLIYNELGNLVWQTRTYSNIENFWDGSSNTNNNTSDIQLPTGTYYFKIILSQKDPIEGFIELLR